MKLIKIQTIHIILLLGWVGGPLFLSAQSGNVGVGVAMPGEKLDVDGNIQLTGEIKLNGSGGTVGQVLTSNGNGTMAWASQTMPASSASGYGNWGDCGTNQNIGDYNPVADPEGKSGDGFGEASAIDGLFAVIASRSDDVGANVNQGSVCVYQFDGVRWNFFQKLTDPAGEANDNFGAAVAIRGNTIVVGAPNDDVGVNVDQGTAVVFRYDGTMWNYYQKIGQVIGFPNDYFGSSVALMNEYIVCGAPYFDTSSSNNKGAVYIFQDDGIQYTQWQSIPASGVNNAAHFGSAVGINSDLEIVVGVPWQNATYSSQGAVHVYLYDGFSWIYGQTLTDPTSLAGEHLGDFISFRNGVLIASQISGNNDKGAASVFEKVNNVYEFSQKLTDPDGIALDRFGQSVSMSQSYAIIGASNVNNFKGKAIIFVKIGTIWKRMQAVTDPYIMGGSNFFGSSLAMDPISKRFVIGAYLAAEKGMAYFGKIN